MFCELSEEVSEKTNISLYNEMYSRLNIQVIVLLLKGRPSMLVVMNDVHGTFGMLTQLVYHLDHDGMHSTSMGIVMSPAFASHLFKACRRYYDKPAINGMTK